MTIKIIPGRGKKTFQVARIPSKMGDAVDMLYELQEMRRAKNKEVDKLKSAEHHMEQELIRLFGKDKLNGAKGKAGQVSLHPRSVPQLKDFKKFISYVVKNKRYDMLQKRLSPEAVMSLLEAKKATAEQLGIGIFKFTAVSCTKIGKKKG